MLKGSRENIAVNQSYALVVEFVLIGNLTSFYEKVCFVYMWKAIPKALDNFSFPFVFNSLKEFTKNSTDGYYLSVLKTRF